MTVSIEEVYSRQLQHLKHSLATTPAIVANQRLKGPSMMLQMNLEFFVRDSLHLSMLECSDSVACATALRRTEAISYLDEFVTLVRSIRESGDQWSVSANTVDIVAVPLLLGDLHRAKTFVDTVLRGAHSTRFWMEYIKALCALLKPEPYRALLPAKLAGSEKHWATYVHLIEAITTGADSEAPVALVNASFNRANRDRRIFNVGAIDPTGNAPHKWDCRLAYIECAHQLAK